MYIKLGELRGKLADQGLPSSMEAVAKGTGIDQRALENMAAQKMKLYRREYIDAICTFFECTPNDAIQIEKVELPMDLAIRPDRRGVKVGEESKKG